MCTLREHWKEAKPSHSINKVFDHNGQRDTRQANAQSRTQTSSTEFPASSSPRRLAIFSIVPFSIVVVMSRPPAPQVMDREGSQEVRHEVKQCCGMCGSTVTVPRKSGMADRPAQVFYDSATAKRTCLGRIHYCLACPGWSKATSMRVVYARWDMVPIHKLPSACASCCCDCGGNDADWLPPPDPKCFKDAKPGEGEGDCCAWQIPCGRTLDTFDADIIVDASAHQTMYAQLDFLPTYP